MLHYINLFIPIQRLNPLHRFDELIEPNLDGFIKEHRDFQWEE